MILTVVNLDPHHVQSGFVELPIEEWQIRGDQPYQVHDLLSDARYLWHGRRNYVEFDPQVAPAHVLRLRRRVAASRTSTISCRRPAPDRDRYPPMSETDWHNDPLWYKDAIIYQVHVKSFFDSDNDGVGDFRGLTEKLDYVQSLGVNAFWLLPFYPSPMRDDGYDIPTIAGSMPNTALDGTFATSFGPRIVAASR